jgi:hypothetical protein
MRFLARQPGRDGPVGGAAGGEPLFQLAAPVAGLEQPVVPAQPTFAYARPSALPPSAAAAT